MDEPQDTPEFLNPDTQGIDEAMLDMASFLTQVTSVEGYLYDEEAETAMQLSSVELSMPVQLDLQVSDAGQVTLGGSPPLYYTETSIMPVFHQMKLTIAVDETKEDHGDIAE